MKKLIFIAIGLVGLVAVKAQDKTDTPQLGIKTNLNVTSFRGDDVQDDDYKLGWGAGLYYHIPINQSLAIQPEVLYSRIGAKYKKDYVSQDGNSTTYSNSTTLDYVQVPVLLKIYPGGSRFNIEIGPQIGFNTYASNKAKFDTKLSTENYNREVKTDLSKFVEDIEYGAVAGLGYNITDHVNFDVRYYLGLNDAFKDGVKTDAKNHGFTFGVGYSF